MTDLTFDQFRFDQTGNTLDISKTAESKQNKLVSYTVILNLKLVFCAPVYNILSTVQISLEYLATTCNAKKEKCFLIYVVKSCS